MATAREARDLYNSIAEDYSAIKTNEYKRWVEETTFLHAVISGGDNSDSNVAEPKNPSVLVDLGCGSGHFCRLIKKEYEKRGGAPSVEVHGIDVSETMVDEAIRLEKEEPLGINYYRANLLALCDNDDDDILSNLKQRADVCTAAYLLPYASKVEDLRKFCLSAARVLQPGGRLISVTSMYTDAIETASVSSGGGGGGGVLAIDTWGFSFVWDKSGDGMLADVTLLGSGRDARVTFPNFLWSRETITQTLLDTGFDRVDWLSPKLGSDAPKDVTAAFEQNDTSATVPVGYFVATLAK